MVKRNRNPTCLVLKWLIKMQLRLCQVGWTTALSKSLWGTSTTHSITFPPCWFIGVTIWTRVRALRRTCSYRSMSWRARQVWVRSTASRSFAKASSIYTWLRVRSFLSISRLMLRLVVTQRWQTLSNCVAIFRLILIPTRHRLLLVFRPTLWTHSQLKREPRLRPKPRQTHQMLMALPRSSHYR